MGYRVRVSLLVKDSTGRIIPAVACNMLFFHVILELRKPSCIVCTGNRLQGCGTQWAGCAAGRRGTAVEKRRYVPT